MARRPGYSECWFCDEIVVDAWVTSIRDRDAENGVRAVTLCRKRSCREAASDKAPAPTYESEVS